jgi:hypothetical protein
MPLLFTIITMFTIVFGFVNYGIVGGLVTATMFIPVVLSTYLVG